MDGQMWRASMVSVALLLGGCGAEPVERSPLWGSLEPGDFGVGFRATTHLDDSRTSENGRARGIEAHVWYPAVDGRAGALRFRDYVHHATRIEADDRDALRGWLAVAVTGSATGVAHDTLDLILDALMYARADAAAARGAHPLVLWTVRHETTVAQSVLSEYLASHGYVVAAVRHAGEPLPFPWAMDSTEEKLRTFETHLEDLSAGLKSLLAEPGVDESRIGVLTWSYAAELAPRIQRIHDSVRIVMGLSSNPLATYGLYLGPLAASFLVPEDLSASYVVMTERISGNGQERRPPPILDELASESFFVSFRDLAHGSFNVVEGMIPGVFGISTVQPWSKGGDVARLGYETIARYARAFLDRALRPEAALEPPPWENESPGAFATTTRYGG